jgi:hemolysin D
LLQLITVAVTQTAVAVSDPVLPRVSILVARGTFYLIAIVLTVSLIWTAVTPVNVVVRAEGKLAPRAEPVRLSVPQGGVVSRVMVDVGAKVAAGAPILEIDPFREAADAAQDRHQLEQAKDEAARYKESAAIFEAAAANIRQSLASQQQVLDLTTQQAKAMRAGFEGGAVSLFEVQTKDREVAEVHARIAQLNSDLKRSEAESAQSHRMETETHQKMKAAEIKLSRDVEVTRKTILSAPTAGVVSSMSSLRPGSYLAANSIAATIVPANEPLLAEVWIPNRSMRRIKPDLPVRMKLNAYPFQQFGLLPGKLISIDPDADASGNYRAWIKPERLTLQGAHGPETLRTGLTMTAEIVVDQRTILNVILDPIRQLRKGFAVAE